MKDKSAFTMRITKLAANRGLDGDTETLIALESMTCNVAHQSEDAKRGRAGLPREARPRLEAPLAEATTMDFAFDDTTLELRERLLAFMDECVYPAEQRFREEVAHGRRPVGHPAGHRGAQGARRASAACGTCSCRRPTSTARG